MRAWIFSDLHIDVNARSPWLIPEPRPEHDVVIIAGDICQGLERGVRWIVEHGINEKPVMYVPGNHEYYGFDFDTEFEAGRAAAAEFINIHVLDRDAVAIDGVVFLGVTLWTDYQLYGERSADIAMMRAERSMNDHRVIRRQDRHWEGSDAVAEYDLSSKWLETQLDADNGKRVVVVTHTAPSLKSVAAQYQTDLLSAANLDHLVERAPLWVHGHTHAGKDYQLGGCRVISNPRGYVRFGEDAGFRAALVCELHAARQA
jgi:Icc-related predicted phosphoesterase